MSAETCIVRGSGGSTPEAYTVGIDILIYALTH